MPAIVARSVIASRNSDPPVKIWLIQSWLCPRNSPPRSYEFVTRCRCCCCWLTVIHRSWSSWRALFSGCILCLSVSPSRCLSVSAGSCQQHVWSIIETLYIVQINRIFERRLVFVVSRPINRIDAASMTARKPARQRFPCIDDRIDAIERLTPGQEDLPLKVA